MEKYKSMPEQLVADWVSEKQDLPWVSQKELKKRGFWFHHLHYHRVEEWLEVLDGEMTFFSADGTPFALGGEKEKVLNIAQGEVHRVEIGKSGVTYRMWTPTTLPNPFLRDARGLRDLIKKNLSVPAAENLYNRRDKNIDPKDITDPETQKARDFLSNFVSGDLIFHTVAGGIIRKGDYLSRGPFPDVRRSSSGSVRILDPRKDSDIGTPLASVLLSTVVHTETEEQGTLQKSSVVNLRSFVKESDPFIKGSKRWVCRLWLNYPDR